MPSSTSNSDARLPAGPWARTWLVALLLAGATLGGYEGALRWRGLRPHITDDAGLWSLARSRVRPHDPDQVVIIGASRAQLGLQPAALAAALGTRPPVQLAVSGSSCMPVLRDLSASRDFRGIVLVDVTPYVFFNTPQHLDGGVQAEFVRQYAAHSVLAAVERRLRLALERRFAVQLPEVRLSWRNLYRWYQRGFPAPRYVETRPDRSENADYARIDLARAAADRARDTAASARPAAPAEWQAALAELRALVGRIQARGGRVVFLRMPVSGAVRAIEDERYPRDVFWDALIRETGALGVNFTDFPTLAQFTCPEGSHLDYRDAEPFSQALGAVLQPLLRPPAYAAR